MHLFQFSHLLVTQKYVSEPITLPKLFKATSNFYTAKSKNYFSILIFLNFLSTFNITGHHLFLKTFSNFDFLDTTHFSAFPFQMLLILLALFLAF